MIFYATVDADSIRSYMPDVPYLLPASSWARYNLRTPKLPSHIKEKAADCGGFVATKVWGSYRYTPAQYTAWLASWSPSWAATMDYCCEDEITAGRPGLVRQRQEKTTRMARYFFRHFPGASWCKPSRMMPNTYMHSAWQYPVAARPLTGAHAPEGTAAHQSFGAGLRRAVQIRIE